MATTEKSKPSITRRNLFKGSTLVVLGGALVYGLGSVPTLKSHELLLRPPGALDEDDFLASCIKCGQCLQVCPPQVIKLAKIDQGFGIGTPYITPREGACILCKGLPCVLACPTGALDHDISEGKEAAMGLAVLSNPQTCLSIQDVNDLVYRLEQWNQSLAEHGTLPSPLVMSGTLLQLMDRLTNEEKDQWKIQFAVEEISPKALPQLLTKLDQPQLSWLIDFAKTAKFAQTACRICLEECPIKEENPIAFQTRTDAHGKETVWPVVQRTCVGCGVCEMKCPTPLPSITTVPRMKFSNTSHATSPNEEEAS